MIFFIVVWVIGFVLAIVYTTKIQGVWPSFSRIQRFHEIERKIVGEKEERLSMKRNSRNGPLEISELDEKLSVLGSENTNHYAVYSGYCFVDDGQGASYESRGKFEKHDFCRLFITL